MDGDDRRQALVSALREWQRLEEEAVAEATALARGTTQPFVRLVALILARDSAMHRRVQQLIIECVQARCEPARPQDVETLRAALTKHAQAEERTMTLAMEAGEALADAGDPALEYLLTYLELDEAKHDRLLDGLRQMARRMRAQ